MSLFEYFFYFVILYTVGSILSTMCRCIQRSLQICTRYGFQLENCYFNLKVGNEIPCTFFTEYYFCKDITTLMLHRNFVCNFLTHFYHLNLKSAYRFKSLLPQICSYMVIHAYISLEIPNFISRLIRILTIFLSVYF